MKCSKPCIEVKLISPEVGGNHSEERGLTPERNVTVSHSAQLMYLNITPENCWDQKQVRRKVQEKGQIRFAAPQNVGNKDEYTPPHL